jgi:hypothetical protein
LVGPGAVDGWDFEAIETAARRTALHVAARAITQRLNADHTDQVGPTVACVRCHQPAHYAGRRAKTFTSVLGPLRLERAYYHCAACAAGFCPRDRALGVDGTALSPAVTRMVGLVGAMVSFAEGHALLHDLAGVDVDAKQVERTAEALGRAIAADEQQVVESPTTTAPTMYLGVDGTGLPMRAAELTGRTGKHPDGSAKTREVKLVTVWTAEGRDPDGIPVRDPGSVTYSAAIESAASPDAEMALSPFAQRVDREAQRRGFDQAPRRVVLGDGAAWIWNLADEGLPGAIQIIDLFHAKQHLSDVAKAIYGTGTDLSRQWARLRHDDLDAGHLRALCQALRPHASTHPEARRCWEYVTHHRGRLRYPAFRAQGLCVSSGVVEAGCKVAIGTRCKRAGMHWTIAGADAIIALRCCQLSGRFEDFWERRSNTAGAKAA